MKKLVLAAAAVVGMAAGTAGAADLPAKPVYKAAPPVVAPTPFSWTGFYVGLNAGGAWGREDEALLLTGNWVGRPEVPGLQAAGSQGLRPSGFVGGGQVGYNFQSGPAVFGIEADLNSLRLHASRFIPNVPNASKDTFSFAASSEVNWMATVRGRVGFAFDHLLLYVTGGLAVTDRKFSQTLTQLDFPFVQTGSVSTTKDRWIIGGGVEYALWNGWSLKGEYLYVDLGQVSFTSAGSCPTTPVCSQYTGSHFENLRIQIARAGINYKFAWGKAAAPVVARY